MAETEEKRRYTDRAGMSEREYAAHAGVSRGAVQKARASGRLVLHAAATSQARIEVTYRPYLSTDIEGPQMDPPITLILTHVEADVFRVTGRARMLDIGTKAFPADTYTARRFPGLTR